jgi:hypothetical protein
MRTGSPSPTGSSLPITNPSTLPPGVYAETDEVAKAGMAQSGKSLLMLEAG